MSLGITGRQSFFQSGAEEVSFDTAPPDLKSRRGAPSLPGEGSLRPDIEA